MHPLGSAGSVGAGARLPRVASHLGPLQVVGSRQLSNPSVPQLPLESGVDNNSTCSERHEES